MPSATAERVGDYAALPEEDREVLALVAAHAESTEDRGLPWPTLNTYVERIARVAPEGLTLPELIGTRSMAKHVALLVNRMIDSGLIRSSPYGLSFTEAAESLRGEWNGDFKRLVAQARGVVDSSA